jgi:hypothetical protein
MSAFGGKADIEVKGFTSAFDPLGSKNTEPKATPDDLLEPSLARAMTGSLQLLI